MGVVLFTFAEIFAVETHYKANAFATVFNGKGGFNDKFVAMLCDIQAGSLLFVY